MYSIKLSLHFLMDSLLSVGMLAAENKQVIIHKAQLYNNNL